MPLRIRTLTARWLLLAVAFPLVLSGCRGCTTDPLVERKKDNPDIDALEKKKKEKKDDFEFKMPRVLPDDADETRAFVKPGHWVTVRNQIKANNFDFQAELFSSSTDSTGRPLRVENTDFQIVSSRPAPLPKGQDKLFDTNYYVPIMSVDPADMSPTKSVWLSRELRASRGGRLIAQDVRQGTVAMPAFQYYFVTLAAEPERYAFLKSLPSLAAPQSGIVETDKLVYYRVVAPKIDRVAPLPHHALTWTSIAYVLWDDIAPAVLTGPQQLALIDWLHWGGQLIICGPNSLEKLRGTYLDPYLPARPGRTVEVSPTAIQEINDHWSLLDTRSGRRGTLDILPEKPLLAVELTKQAQSEYVPKTGELLVERRVGAGRIVVSAFSLTDSHLMRWKSLDNFLNGALLRRPRREFRAVDGMPSATWADYPDYLATDARLSSTVRIFSRDVGHFADTMTRSGGSGQWEPGEAPVRDPTDPTVPQSFPSTPARIAGMPGTYYPPQSPAARMTPQLDAGADDWHFRGFPFRRNSGMAAWNDRSGVSDAAREALRDASGITVPKGDFVLKVLAVYLLVLAPLNWLVFRILGRVEWAWVAAPVVAIAGTFAVVRMAQLDIGFARSMTEVAVAEMHSGYPRAHLTRYTALYTSLSTSYDLEFADDGALAQPFAPAVEQRLQPQLLRPTLHEVSLRRDKVVRLSGFLVDSNTEGFVHSEQIADMNGAFSLVGPPETSHELHNGTRMTLHAAGVFRRTREGLLESAWIGDLPAKSTIPLKFQPAAQQHLQAWNDSPITLSHNVHALAVLAELDVDKDRSLSRREVRPNDSLADQFDRFDENQDRRLDRSELLIWCRQSRAGELSVGSLLELASGTLKLLPGEVTLVGCSYEEIPGLAILPQAAQMLRRTVFLVHLNAGNLPTPQSDLRLLSDVQEIKPENAGENTSSPDNVEVPATAKP